jgi:hypothetical protein
LQLFAYAGLQSVSAKPEQANRVTLNIHKNFSHSPGHKITFFRDKIDNRITKKTGIFVSLKNNICTMKSFIITGLAFLSSFLSAQTLQWREVAPGCGDGQPAKPLKLWYDRPAKVWDEALPPGNGHIGAMVYGNPLNEYYQLNENTLRSGTPREGNNRNRFCHRKGKNVSFIPGRQIQNLKSKI